MHIRDGKQGEYWAVYSDLAGYAIAIWCILPEGELLKKVQASSPKFMNSHIVVCVLSWSVAYTTCRVFDPSDLHCVSTLESFLKVVNDATEYRWLRVKGV